MKILVTGGLGYIGRVMVDAILEEGDEPRILDRVLYANHFTPPKNGVEMIEADISQDLALEKALKNVDAVVHLAAIVGDQACDLDKESAVHTNYLATRKLAHLCAREKIRLLFFSTCSVYGAKPGTLITEEDAVLPLSIYSITKLAAEEAVAGSGAEHVTLRLGTVYGFSPRMRFDLVINRMIAQATRDRTITVFGGEQYRPFIHVKDVVSNSLKALHSENVGLYNLGGENWRILELGEKIRKATGCRMKIYEDIRDPRNYSVDSALAVKTWGAIFKQEIDVAIQEIQESLEKGVFAHFDDPLYNNADWLRRSSQ